MPQPRPSLQQLQEQLSEEEQARRSDYPSQGVYEVKPRDVIENWLADQAREKSMSSYLTGPPPLPVGQAIPVTSSPDASFWQGFKRFLLGAAAESGFNAKEQFGIQTKAAGDVGPQTVTLSGTPSVTITNPPPRPNITISMPVTIHEAQNADAVARQLGQAVRNEMNGLQAATNDSGL